MIFTVCGSPLSCVEVKAVDGLYSFLITRGMWLVVSGLIVGFRKLGLCGCRVMRWSLLCAFVVLKKRLAALGCLPPPLFKAALVEYPPLLVSALIG